MDPVSLTLGGVVAGVVANLLKDGESKVAKAAWAAGGRLLGAIRRRFRDHGSETDRAALELLEQAPDSQRAQEGLAAALDRHAADNDFATDLRGKLKEVRQAGLSVGPISQSTSGDHNVQVGVVSGSNIIVTER